MLRKSLAAGLTLAIPLAITVGVLAGVWNLGGRLTAQVAPGQCTSIIQYSLPQSATGAFGFAQRIAMGVQELWFTGYGEKIGKITMTGTVTYFPFPSRQTRRLGGIARGPDGNMWFIVTNNDPVFPDAIGKITPSGIITEYPLSSKGLHTLDNIVAGSDGNLWFTKRSSSIGKITPSGTITEYLIPSGAYAVPEGIEAGPDGNVWFTESNIGKIGRITPSGSITEFSMPQGNPRDIAASAGHLWYALGGYPGAIGRMTTAGTPMHYPIPVFGSQGASPNRMARAPDGTLWFTGGTQNDLGRITTEGGTVSLLSTGLVSANDIAFGSDGALWIALSSSYHIARIIPSSCTFPTVTSSSSSRSSSSAPSGTVTLQLTVTPYPGTRTGNIESLPDRQGWYRIGVTVTGGEAQNVVLRFPMPPGTPSYGSSGFGGCVPEGNFNPPVALCNLGDALAPGTYPLPGQPLLIFQFPLPCGTSQRAPESLSASNAATVTTSGTPIQTTVPTSACAGSSSSSVPASSAQSSSLTSSAQGSSAAPSSVSSVSSPPATPDICSPICGDGRILNVEECDDGNLRDGDGCSSVCRIERVSSSSSSSSQATSFSASSSQATSSSASSESSLPFECPTDPCGMGGDGFCAEQGRTCIKDLNSDTCITCSGDYVCQGDECGQGGDQYCASLGSTCDHVSGGICIECRAGSSSSAGIECPEDACSLGGNQYCASFGKSCTPTQDNICVKCFPEPDLPCSGTGVECKQGGDEYCALFGAVCKPATSGICIHCVQPGKPGVCSGSNYECSQGGSQYCALFGKKCRGIPDGICIECTGGPGDETYDCRGNECALGGALYCGTQGLNCRSIRDGICIACTQEGCRSALDCAGGSQCVNQRCVQLCGNGRIDPGEACDPSTTLGTNSSCTPNCLLAEQQQCTYDTECRTGLCIRNLCVPCSTSTQCQSNDCRQGVCRPQCGNGRVDPGEACDPILDPHCTIHCLRPAGITCRIGLECQTGLCGGGSCTTCTGNNQCGGSGVCASGTCVRSCGDGRLDSGEECDDGNRITGDGCDRFCRREATVAGEILPVSLLGDLARGGTIEGGDMLEAELRGERQARSLATMHAAAGETGPAALAVIAGGAAAGWAWMRRRRKS